MIITIHDTRIVKEHIIGVGPIMRISKNDEVHLAFNVYRFEFTVYLTYYSIVIATDDLKFSGLDKEQSIGMYKRFKDEHTGLCALLDSMSKQEI